MSLLLLFQGHAPVGVSLTPQPLIAIPYGPRRLAIGAGARSISVMAAGRTWKPTK